MNIEVLGTGCSKCTALFENVKQAVANQKIFAQIEKVEDIEKIMQYSVMSTPALVINQEVKSTGKVLSVEEISKLLNS
ncbi:thioredoxin family protein [Malaciobacter halophilus]|uniref:Thioredoxin family protein n=1 Tax=Malaciobacter halophilus TaxID=197482 RepID=A0A2N1J5H2_9BACT|nr:thioredoxin family protein [Malaciobacter halophilus]AXH10774.1 thioredoxin family protein (Thioredoxin_3 domain) [Malaciobacter halophilus]PKI81793.1 thioredoxin family protein [Malaciobacter halophilus]